jgi:hypothetical protein
MSSEVNPKKALKIIGGLFAFLLLWPFLRAVSTSNDLNLFYSAAERLSSLQNLYDPGYNSQGWILKYYYSPLFATALLPFTLLSNTPFLPEQIPFSIIVLKLIWGLFMVWLIWDIAILLSEKFTFVSPKKKVWFWGVLAFLTWRWCFLNLLYGQMTILVVWGVLRAFRNPETPSVKNLLPMSLGINIKVLPIFILGQYFLQQQWRAFFTVIFLTVLLAIVPFGYLPFDYHVEMIKGWFYNINPFSGSHIVEVGEGGFVDFGALVTKYMTSLYVPGEATIQSFQWSHIEVFWSTQAFRLLVLFLSWMGLKIIEKGNYENKSFWQMALFLGVVPIAFPHQRDYSLMLQLPIVALVVKDWVDGQIRLTIAHKVVFVLGGILMGNLLFLEALPTIVRLSWQGFRLQGIGGMIVWFGFVHYLVFSSNHLLKKVFTSK